MIEEARRRSQGRGRLLVADLAEPLPVEAQSLDGITSLLREAAWKGCLPT